MFSEAEIKYLKSQRLGRLATVSKDGKPDVAAVAYEFDGRDFYIGSYIMKKTRKYWNIKNGNPKVSFVVDDLASVNPWIPRGIKIDGKAEIIIRSKQSSGPAGTMSPEYIRLTPESSRSWRIEPAEPSKKQH